MRTAQITRKTKETDIKTELYFDGKGTYEIETGIGFFDHMLTAFAVHSGISVKINVVGDLFVDAHHTVEDTGIVLGQAIAMALGNKANIKRYGNFTIPMDESLASCSMDISNRPFLVFNADFSDEKIGEYDTALTEEFFRALAFNAGITLHLNALYGKNSHHKTEALFKAFAYALKEAVTEKGQSNSTKGIVEIVRK
ncbi:MAG: imidazoleglycerol-phosphate dehydratase HisB [Oscillospiraceae bacterium]|jgi:imidazoleglycerol-phosphate dehydratase|nr:imidazoleglycerol-phosphate dehydratase HisB [Oscillospiraceae bacterium]